MLAPEVSAQTGLRSLRLVSDLVGRLRVSLPASLKGCRQQLYSWSTGTGEFPELLISPKCAVNMRGEGHLLNFNDLTDLGFASVDKKVTLLHLH